MRITLGTLRRIIHEELSREADEGVDEVHALVSIDKVVYDTVYNNPEMGSEQCEVIFEMTLDNGEKIEYTQVFTSFLPKDREEVVAGIVESLNEGDEWNNPPRPPVQVSPDEFDRMLGDKWSIIEKGLEDDADSYRRGGY